VPPCNVRLNSDGCTSSDRADILKNPSSSLRYGIFNFRSSPFLFLCFRTHACIHTQTRATGVYFACSTTSTSALLFPPPLSLSYSRTVSHGTAGTAVIIVLFCGNCLSLFSSQLICFSFLFFIFPRPPLLQPLCRVLCSSPSVV
jgi:hypothetical protein